MIEQACRHLGAAGIVHADEQHFRGGLHDCFLGLGQCGEPVNGEPQGQPDQVDADLRGAPQRGVGLEDVALDGLGAERADELRGQFIGGSGEDRDVGDQGVWIRRVWRSSLTPCGVVSV
jgi:hypothetical protein